MTTEPVIICPNCSTEIKLTESLAAPLYSSNVRQDYETKLADKEQSVAKREEQIREQQKAIEAAKSAIDEQVAEKLSAERKTIVAEEAKKAKLAAATDLEAKTRELTDLQEILKQIGRQSSKKRKRRRLSSIRKERELDDAKRELDLTVEKRVQESVNEVREKAKKEAEECLKAQSD